MPGPRWPTASSPPKSWSTGHVDAARKLAVEGADDVALDKAESSVRGRPRPGRYSDGSDSSHRHAAAERPEGSCFSGHCRNCPSHATDSCSRGAAAAEARTRKGSIGNRWNLTGGLSNIDQQCQTLSSILVPSPPRLRHLSVTESAARSRPTEGKRHAINPTRATIHSR